MDTELNRIMCEIFVESLAVAGVMIAAYWVVSALWKRKRS